MITKENNGKKYLLSDIKIDGLELLCDPLTSLLSYKSFKTAAEYYLTLSSKVVNLAIGDVDNLKNYVTSQNRREEKLFGHLAGNNCMEQIGRIVNHWSEELLKEKELLCGTFGGDEIIVWTIGCNSRDFNAAIIDLSTKIKENCPVTCSFVSASISINDYSSAKEDLYHCLASFIDSQLFDFKNARKNSNSMELVKTLNVLYENEECIITK